MVWAVSPSWVPTPWNFRVCQNHPSKVLPPSQHGRYAITRAEYRVVTTPSYFYWYNLIWINFLSIIGLCRSYSQAKTTNLLHVILLSNISSILFLYGCFGGSKYGIFCYSHNWVCILFKQAHHFSLLRYDYLSDSVF